MRGKSGTNHDVFGEEDGAGRNGLSIHGSGCAVRGQEGEVSHWGHEVLKTNEERRKEGKDKGSEERGNDVGVQGRKKERKRKSGCSVSLHTNKFNEGKAKREVSAAERQHTPDLGAAGVPSWRKRCRPSVFSS